LANHVNGKVGENGKGGNGGERGGRIEGRRGQVEKVRKGEGP